MDDRAGLQGAIRELTDPMVVMRRVVDQALLLLPQAEGAAVELAAEGVLTYVCAGGNLSAYVGIRLQQAASLSGLAVRTGQTLRCDDSATDPRVDRAACERVGAVSMVCVPLRRGGQPVGVLKVSAARPRVFGDADVAILTRLADFITAAIGAASDLSRISAGLLDDSVRPVEATSGQSTASTAGPADVGVGAFVANVLRPGLVGDVEVRERVQRALTESAFDMVCQPILDLATGELVGAEALARFSSAPSQGPDAWFDDAQRVGLGVELELAAVRKALALLDRVPRGAYLAVNVGPETILTDELRRLLDAVDTRRVVIELTEHLQVGDYRRLTEALTAVRKRGARLAIDDTGAGFAGLAHMLKLAPDVIKLDRDITGGIDFDPVRRALASALVSFAAGTGAKVIAEGIETADELDTVRHLGIRYGQGYQLGRPGPVAALTRAAAHVVTR